jgi:hypothetical protein
MPAPSPSSDPATDPRLLRLHADDNVLVARAPIPAGAPILVAGVAVTLAVGLPIGHKLASRAIAAGEKVRKYGAPIGTATADIARGELVHLHNLRSDYTPSVALAGEAP